MYSEKRSQGRIRRTIPIRLYFVSLETKSDAAGLPGQTVEISPGGLCFSCDRLIPPGTHVHLKVEQEKAGNFLGHIHHGAIVRWSQREARTGTCLIGVEFTDTPANEVRKWIDQMNFRSDPMY